MKYYLFNKESLPPEFKFPKSYINFLEIGQLPDIEPWHFLCKSPEESDRWLKQLKKLYPNRKLIPFADTAGASDDVVCFDGNSTIDEAKVIYIHAYASPGWECRGEEKDFQSWLNETQEYSLQFKADNY